MSSAAGLGRRRLPERAVSMPALANAALLCALLALSLFLRTRNLDAWFWIDEGLSVGISSYSLTDIAGVLRQDGSPPLYYMLLNVWVDAVGRSEVETHLLSLAFALACVPAGLWAGWSLFGRRTGWICAGLFAINPFVTHYAQETRMYSLLMLLGLLATACFLHAFVFRRRLYLAPFAVLLALMLYTHNWAIFFGAGAAAALIPAWHAAADRRGLVRDAALAFGGTALLFLPWLPTLAYQVANTGAPWSIAPTPSDALKGLSRVLNGNGPAIAALLGTGAGFVAGLRSERLRTRTALIATLTLGLATLVLAFASSQVSPAWALRYFAVLIGPLLLLAAAGLARASGLGLAVLVLLVLFWVDLSGNDSDYKSNLRGVVVQFEDRLRPGDLVLSTHPERLPNIHYYLGDRVRYATSLDPSPDPRAMDWRDALDRLEAARVPGPLAPVLDSLPRGSRLLLVQPATNTGKSWDAPWTSLVKHRAREWGRFLAHDERFKRVGSAPPPERARKLNIGVRAVLYTKS
jgi:mannosyltransferase